MTVLDMEKLLWKITQVYPVPVSPAMANSVLSHLKASPMTLLKRLAKPALLRAARLLRVSQSEGAVARASADYWAGGDDERFRANSHWRGGAFDDATWLALGRPHLDLWRQFAAFAGLDPSPRRVVEWGCGGGANAVHFAPLAERFVGVDVSRATLDECGRQLDREGLGDRYEPVLADVEHPEAAAATIAACDLFLCTYVFELLPGPDHARRLLRVARGLLRPGGAALVQFKYATDDPRTRGRRWAYRLNLANTTTFRAEAFWTLADDCGLTPRCLTLVPKQPLVGDERYAYFLLTRPGGATAALA